MVTGNVSWMRIFDEKKITERKRKVDIDSSKRNRVRNRGCERSLGRNREKKVEGIEEVQGYRKELEVDKDS